jgi:hypothetical protein
LLLQQAGEPEYTVESDPGAITLRGDFLGVYDAAAQRNVAPEGARQVVLSTNRGQVLEVGG